MCGSALTGLGSADGLVSRVVGRVSVVVGASVVVAQAVTSSTRATPPNHLITRPSSRTVDWSIRIGAEARRGPLPIWNLNQEPVAAVEVRRLRSCWGGVSRRTSVRSGHWPTSHVQSPRAHPVAQAVMPRVGTRRTAPGLSRRGRSLVNLERKGSDSALKPTQCSPCQWGEFWWTACCATSPPIRL